MFNHLRWINTTKEYLNTSNTSSEALKKWYYITTTTKNLWKMTASFEEMGAFIRWKINSTVTPNLMLTPNNNVKAMNSGCWAAFICMCCLSLCTWFTEGNKKIRQQRIQHAKLMCVSSQFLSIQACSGWLMQSTKIWSSLLWPYCSSGTWIAL